MAITLAQLNGWASLGRPLPDLVYASSELGLPTRGRSADELLTELVASLSQEIVARGPQAEANVSADFANYVQTAFAPRQQPQRAAASSTQAAQAATSHTASAPQGNARPVKKNALQRFLHPDPRTPEDEKLSGWELFKKYR
jgi:hypothetical protein